MQRLLLMSLIPALTENGTFSMNFGLRGGKTIHWIVFLLLSSSLRDSKQYTDKVFWSVDLDVVCRSDPHGRWCNSESSHLSDVGFSLILLQYRYAA